MERGKTYREYIYGNYADSLEHNLLTGDPVRERRLICAYFRKNYLPYFPADKNCRVLDLGCGMGNYVYAARRYGYRNVTGVDASKPVVNYCRRNGLDCVHADAREFLESHCGQYDVILFNDVVEHFKKEELFDVLTLLRQALKGGGRVIIKTMNLSNPITGAMGMFLDFTHETGFTETSMRQVLLAASFQEVVVRGADIYVSPKPFIYLLRAASRVINAFWYLCCCLYGRTTVRIFDKNLLAVAFKGD